MVTSSQDAKPDDSRVVATGRSVNRSFVSLDPERQPEVAGESARPARKKAGEVPTEVAGADTVPAKNRR